MGWKAATLSGTVRSEENVYMTVVYRLFCVFDVYADVEVMNQSI